MSLNKVDWLVAASLGAAMCACSGPQAPPLSVSTTPPAASAPQESARPDATAPTEASAPTDATAPSDVVAPSQAAAVALAPSPAATLPTEPCFGDTPPASLAPDPRPRDIFATGTSVVWRSSGLVHVMDLAGASQVFDAHDLALVGTADARELFGAGFGQLDLIAVDLASGHERVVVPGSAFDLQSRGLQMRGFETLYGAEYLLDGDYVYIAWHGDPGIYNTITGSNSLKGQRGPHEIAKLSRVRRDGSAPPELLGAGPDGRFVVHDDFAYYGTRWQGLKRRRLARWPHTEMVWSAPDVQDMWVLGTSGRDLFFAFLTAGSPHFSVSIASISFTSTEDAGLLEPHVYVTSAPVAFRSGVVVGHCVYAGGPDGVLRADLTSGTIKRIFEGHVVRGDATVTGSSLLAADSSHLYYADYGGDRVVRWSR